jgi:hypothetical protein
METLPMNDPAMVTERQSGHCPWMVALPAEQRKVVHAHEVGHIYCKHDRKIGLPGAHLLTLFRAVNARQSQCPVLIGQCGNFLHATRMLQLMG